ncbi:hypothetical protein G4B88_013701 [Cannabis sativa]|uniref:RNase H type-1 domain-containing protein n=1 Tax=Cannabis sativa TaxID=3483 RepID=A0A7J6HTP4_CANSA|nr:hypothetical protein G4B88_013701 [Cannabis sativa]
MDGNEDDACCCGTALVINLSWVRVDHVSRNLSPAVNHWIDLSPPVGWMSCCTDISVVTDHSRGAAVFRDSNNRVCCVWIERFAATDPSLAEAQMLVCAAQVAVRNRFLCVSFFCDNTEVVSTFLEADRQNRNLNLDGAAMMFRNCTKGFQSFKLTSIGREANFMAHNAAKWAKFNSVVGEIDLRVMDPEVFVDHKEWYPEPG